MKEIDLEKLYEIAGKEALTIESELNSLAKLLVKNFELRTFFENATFSKEAKTKLLAEVMPGVSVLFRNLIGLLIDENMEKAAIKLSERFTQLAARKSGTVFAEVGAAAGLSEGEKKRIVDWLGGQVNLREEIDPDLIGGVKIFTSDGKYFDGTLSGALENLKEAIIKKRIGEFQSASKVEEVGTVIESGDGIIRIKGLPGALAGEMVEFPGKIFGMVFNLEREDILAVLLGPHTAIKEGDLVKSTGRVMEVPVGEGLIGRVVDAIGEPIDGLGPIKTKNFRPVERLAPGVIDRTPVSQPLQTGYKLIDALIPIGRGQRELIIGDRSTRKSVMGIDAILNQKGENVVCVYVAIGQKEANILQVIETLREHGAMDYTIVVSASASDPAALQYLAPYAGCAMAEEFMF